jgi:hypothetical protein
MQPISGFDILVIQQISKNMNIKLYSSILMLASGLVFLSCEKETNNCINPDLINSDAIITYNYSPVCGCDGVTYPNESAATAYGGVTSWTEGPCENSNSNCENMENFTVVIDGDCGILLRASDNSMFEVDYMDINVNLYHGQYVGLVYEQLNYLGSCSGYTPIKVTEICSLNACQPISIATGGYSADPITINNLSIVDDCLHIYVSYSGGCEIHSFEIFNHVFCGTPPITAFLMLDHNDMDDPCDAIVQQTLKFDLSSLQDLEPNGSLPIVVGNTSNNNTFEIIYNF